MKRPVNHTSQYDKTRNNLTHVACLGREEYPAHRRSNPSGKKIKDQTYQIEYVDEEDGPYAVSIWLKEYIIVLFKGIFC